MSETSNIVCPHCGATNRVPTAKLSDGPKCGKCKQDVLAGPVDLNSGNFIKFLTRNDLPVVVDFWADWCGPCKMMAPAFAQAAQQNKTKARFAKLNTETEQQLAGQYGIRSIPTMIVFKHGKEIARQSGAMDAQSLAQWVNQFS